MFINVLTDRDSVAKRLKNEPSRTRDRLVPGTRATNLSAPTISSTYCMWEEQHKHGETILLVVKSPQASLGGRKKKALKTQSMMSDLCLDLFKQT